MQPRAKVGKHPWETPAPFCSPEPAPQATARETIPISSVQSRASFGSRDAEQPLPALHVFPPPKPAPVTCVSPSEHQDKAGDAAPCPSTATGGHRDSRRLPEGIQRNDSLRAVCVGNIPHPSQPPRGTHQELCAQGMADSCFFPGIPCKTLDEDRAHS